MRHKVNHHIKARNRGRLLWGLAWLSAGVGPAWAVDLLPMTVTPESGTVLTSGQDYQVHIETPGETGQVSTMVAFGVDMGVNAIQRTAVTPIDFNMNLPWDRTGPFVLYIIGEVSDPSTGTVLKHSELSLPLYAMPASTEIPVKLAPRNNTALYAAKAPASGETPKSVRIGPRAVYSDGRSRNVELGALGTTYASSDPSIATVDADGRVTPVAPGTIFVAYQYLGVRDFATISVQDSSTGRATAVDFTSQLAVSAGGFRRDAVTGLYTQLVSIKNMGEWPIPRPIHLVVSDLPLGVTMPENGDVTRVVDPVGSPTARISPPADAPFLLPGASATVVLRFRDPDALPITYTRRVFGGEYP